MSDRIVRVGVAPVTDTLKRVADDGTLLGTADRDEHRLLVGPVEVGPVEGSPAPGGLPHEHAADLLAQGYEIRPLLA